MIFASAFLCMCWGWRCSCSMLEAIDLWQCGNDSGSASLAPTPVAPKLYPWQAAAVDEGKRGANLVYCAPTSGGKSLVADVLMVRRLLARRPPPEMLRRQRRRRRNLTRPRALVVLPYISIVAEKVAHLREVLQPMGLEVRRR